ncbi:hypothetical protein CEXT_429461 [Caerostris extrusa]|uniref:Uncharacterized protein n=1 Tax=Caerostris extrusa TaxID=172846 RepID=A0AAV4SX16_CAEEX|nr:hypothetical protein CEXT_429461 [Caerostris extrusa]
MNEWMNNNKKEAEGHCSGNGGRICKKKVCEGRYAIGIQQKPATTDPKQPQEPVRGGYIERRFHFVRDCLPLRVVPN